MHVLMYGNVLQWYVIVCVHVCYAMISDCSGLEAGRGWQACLFRMTMTMITAMMIRMMMLMTMRKMMKSICVASAASPR